MKAGIVRLASLTTFFISWFHLVVCVYTNLKLSFHGIHNTAISFNYSRYFRRDSSISSIISRFHESLQMVKLHTRFINCCFKCLISIFPRDESIKMNSIRPYVGSRKTILYFAPQFCTTEGKYKDSPQKRNTEQNLIIMCCKKKQYHQSIYVLRVSTV